MQTRPPRPSLAMTWAAAEAWKTEFSGEKWRICPREIDGTWRNPWEEHEDFNGESMENGVRLSKMFFLLWELICDTFALFDYRNMLLIVVIEHVGHVGSDKDVLFLFWFSFIRSR